MQPPSEVQTEAPLGHRGQKLPAAVCFPVALAPGHKCIILRTADASEEFPSQEASQDRHVGTVAVILKAICCCMSCLYRAVVCAPCLSSWFITSQLGHPTAVLKLKCTTWHSGAVRLHPINNFCAQFLRLLPRRRIKRELPEKTTTT